MVVGLVVVRSRIQFPTTVHDVTVFCTSQWAGKITAGIVERNVSYCLASDYVTCGLTFWGLSVQYLPVVCTFLLDH